MPNVQNVPIEELHRFCLDALLEQELPRAHAETTTDALVTADAMGVFTHGTKLLAGYLHRLQGGGYRADATPTIARQGPAWAVIDGHASLGQVGTSFALRTAIDKARTVGIAYAAVTNTGHIGAAGYYAAQAAQQGMLAMVMGNDIPSVAAPGSRGPVLGSNPLAYGIPMTGGDPILLDMATAAVAGGKVYAAHQRGEPIPATWLIGPDGQPTTDGSLYPQQASLAPMAGHKGYGLSVWIEVLSAVLPGGAMTWQVGSWMFDPPDQPSKHNAALLVIDVAAISPAGEFQARLQHLINELRSAPAAERSSGVMLPGQREWQALRHAETAGIALPNDVRDKLRTIVKSGAPMPSWLA